MNLRAFLTALVLLPCCALAQQPPQPAPEVLFKTALADLSGQPATLERLHGQPLIVNFWARWCGPCQTEIPDIVAEYPRAQKTGVQVLGIALDTKPDAVRDFAKAYDMDYPVLLVKDNGPELLKQLGNPKAGLPYTLVIGRDGKVVTQKLGAMSRAEVVSAIEAAAK